MPENQKPPPKRAKWWRVVLAPLVALLILCALEGVLRLAGFGYPTSFFIPGREGFVESNERFAWRFMPPEMARDPLMIQMAKKKPPGTVRIFVLGESAAQGFPDSAFGFSRILEVMLRARHPGTNFDIINTAVTAINSHAVREIGRECMQYEPDLLILYCGNNEVVGPFGPGTIFQSATPGLGWIRFQLCLSRTRIWQGITRLVKPAPKQWVGMEMFLERRLGGGDPRLEKVYDSFSANITDILKASREQNVPLVVCTVPVNLEGCSPFASVHRRNFPDAEELKWNESLAAGTNAEARGEWSLAEKHYAEAETLDARFAEVNFRRAGCLAALNRTNESSQEFCAARDHDALRFRADSRINELIRGLASNRGQLVSLYDAAAEFAKLPGDLFHEHVHLTFSGNYLLAKGFLPYVETALALEKPSTVGEKPISSEGECAERLAFTLWARLKADKSVVKLVRRPPFTLQFNHGEVLSEKARRLREESELASSSAQLQRAVDAYRLVLNERPDDFYIRGSLIEVLDQRGDFELAIHEAQGLLKQLPGRTRPKLVLGDELLHARKLDEAMQLYREVIRGHPELAVGYECLGDALVQAHRDDEALTAFRMAITKGSDAPELHNDMAVLLQSKGDLAGAEAHLLRALEWTDDPVWHSNLGLILYSERKLEAAVPHLQRAVSAMPSNVVARQRLDLSLSALGRTITTNAANR